ncbi:MAG: outer membrane beta-barrel family protein [Arachidicoccus sp.]|nr:outer membrane beta-barrel family protein [Arachidicoccus sp.]
MRNHFISFILLLCIINVRAYAQKADTGSLSGKIVDTISHNLTKATIVLLDAKDTTKKWQTLSGNDGTFSFHGLPISLYSIRISYLGYDVVNKYVGLTQAKPSLDVGDITLEQTINDIGTVIVTAIIPVTMKGDTTEYSADAFGTKPNATVEDLLKKLPGVQVDKNGAITAQGESVTRVFVDGKRFFGNDPKMATQNLPKDVVDKIQVFDGKTDQAEFTGFDDGTNIKTINIVTKRNMRHGWFGRSTASIGNDEATLKDPLYAITPRIMYFNGDMKIGMFGNLNNVNVQNFTRTDQNNKNGLTKTAAGNIFFGNTWGKTDFNGGYSINNIKVDLDQKTYKQNFYGDTTQNNIINQLTNRSNTNNNLNLNFDTKFDSSNELRVRPSISFTHSNTSNSGTTEIDSLFQNINTVKSFTDAKNSSINDGRNASLSTTYRHAFDKKGRTISLDVQYSNTHNNSSGLNYSNVRDSIFHTDSLTNQTYSTINNGNSISPTLSYTEPIANHQLLELEYNYSYSKNTSDRRTFNIDPLDNILEKDTALTNYFENTYSSNRGTLSYMYSDSIMNISVGTGIQFGKTESNNLTKNIYLSNKYTNFYPTANFQYKFSNTKRIRFSYQGRTSQPSVSQLQPVTDNSNPLNVTSGNPDLKQSFSNNLQLRYYNVDKMGGRSFFIFLSGSFINNQIVNGISRLPNGGQYSMPVNINGYYNFRGSFDYGFPIVHGNYNFDFVTNASRERTPSLVNSNKEFTTNTSFSETMRFTTNLQKSWDINFTTTPGYNISKYTISQGNSNANYYQQESTIEGTWYTNSGWEIGTDFNYTFYTGKSQGQNVSIPLWNATLTKQIFKNKAGEISLSVHDILNQNKGVSFTRGDNYSTQTTTNILKRYVLLSFTYNLKEFPGMKGKRNRNRNGQQPGMRDRDNFDGGDRGGPPGGGGGGGFGGGGRGGF